MAVDKGFTLFVEQGAKLHLMFQSLCGTEKGLRAFGVTEVIINVHHFAGMIEQYLQSKNNFGMRIEISREDDLLLDTGGGLKKAAWFFLEGSVRHNSTKADEPFLLHNVDVISNIDLAAMLHRLGWAAAHLELGLARGAAVMVSEAMMLKAPMRTIRRSTKK